MARFSACFTSPVNKAESIWSLVALEASKFSSTLVQLAFPFRESYPYLYKLSLCNEKEGAWHGADIT